MTSSTYVVIYVVFDNKSKVNWFFISIPSKLNRYIVSCVLVFSSLLTTFSPLALFTRTRMFRMLMKS